MKFRFHYGWIVVGVTFIAFLTATVTSYFVSAEQNEARTNADKQRSAEQTHTVEALHRIEQRLTEIEAKLEA